MMFYACVMRCACDMLCSVLCVAHVYLCSACVSTSLSQGVLQRKNRKLYIDGAKQQQTHCVFVPVVDMMK